MLKIGERINKDKIKWYSNMEGLDILTFAVLSVQACDGDDMNTALLGSMT